MRKRKKTKPSSLLIEPTEGKTFVEVFSEIRYKIKPKGSGVEVPSIRKTKGGRALTKLGPKKNQQGYILESG